MIKPLKGSDAPAGSFVVCDIENWPDGRVITIDTAWRDAESGDVKHFQTLTWKKWWQWIRFKARRDQKFRCIYAHNGGGWDWLSLAHYLLTEGKQKHQFLTGAMAASKIVTMEVTIRQGKKSRHGLQIKLCDSLQLLRSPLRDLAEKFDVVRKVDIGGRLPYEVFVADRELYDRYVRADTESLLMVLDKALELIREKVAPIATFGHTIGATAMKVFRTIGLEKPIAVPKDEKVKAFLREGYTGGRVEVFKPGVYAHVRVYDINSLYPFAMLTTAVPVSDRGIWMEEFQSGSVGCYSIRFEQQRRDIPPLFMSHGVGVYAGRGTYYSPEIELFKRIGAGELEVEKGYAFLDTAKVFQDYVNKLYALRLADPDGPVSLLAKFLLNSLYGKFSQKSERVNIVHIPDYDEFYRQIENGTRLRTLSDELDIYQCITESPAPFEHVGIAGMITSAARVKLYEGMLDAGAYNVVYCDTDSVHTTGVLSERMVGKAIGQFKPEFSGE